MHLSIPNRRKLICAPHISTLKQNPLLSCPGFLCLCFRPKVRTKKQFLWFSINSMTGLIGSLFLLTNSIGDSRRWSHNNCGKLRLLSASRILFNSPIKQIILGIETNIPIQKNTIYIKLFLTLHQPRLLITPHPDPVPSNNTSLQTRNCSSFKVQRIVLIFWFFINFCNN